MKKTFYIYIILIGLIVVSCRPKSPRPKTFTFIDLTYSNGWNELVRIHLDSNKCVRIQIDRHNKSKIFLQDTLTDSTFFKIDSLASYAFSMKHDTLNGQPIPDGGGCNIIVKSRLNEIRIMNWAGATCCEQMNRLMGKVITLKDKIKKVSADTTYIFPSYWRLAPPKMVDSVTFVPPIIKEDEVDISANH